MVFNKMILLAVLALAAFQVRADDGEITDWCKPCSRLIDDFTPELKTDAVQKAYVRACNDVYLDEEDYNKQCQDFYTQLLTQVRDALNAGQNGQAICTSFGACQDSQTALRAKFASYRQQHARFQKGFKLF